MKHKILTLIFLLSLACGGSSPTGPSLAPAPPPLVIKQVFEFTFTGQQAPNLLLRYRVPIEKRIRILTETAVDERRVSPTQNIQESRYNYVCANSYEKNALAELIGLDGFVEKTIFVTIPKCNNSSTPTSPTSPTSPDPPSEPDPTDPPTNPPPPPPDPPPTESEDPIGLKHYFDSLGKDGVGTWRISFLFKVNNCSASVSVSDSKGTTLLNESVGKQEAVNEMFYYKCSSASDHYTIRSAAWLGCPGGNSVRSDAELKVNCSK